MVILSEENVMSNEVSSRLRKRRHSLGKSGVRTEEFQADVVVSSQKSELHKYKKLLRNLIVQEDETSHDDFRVSTKEGEHSTDSSIADTSTKQQEEIRKLKTDQEELRECVTGKEKDTGKTTSSEKYGQRKRNCRLLSKLLNDTNDRSSHQEEKSDASRVCERDNIFYQIRCGQSLTSKQHTDPSGVLLEKNGVSDDQSENKKATETNLRRNQRSKEEKNDADHSKTYAISVEDKGYNKDSINAAIRRNNPHLVELITREDTVPYGEEPNQGSERHNEGVCKNFILEEVKEVTFRGKSENFNQEGDCEAESISNTAEPDLSQKSGSRKGDSDNDVDGDETTEIRDRHEKVQTKKTSIRLRRRSGEIWAIRYEKDFVLTPLAKLSKDDATFLPSKGTDATIVSEENLLKEVRSRKETLFAVSDPHDGNFASSSTSSVVRKPKVKYKRRKNKRKYTGYITNNNFASKKKVTWTLPFQSTGIYCHQ